MTDTKDNPRSGRLEFQIKELKEENKLLLEKNIAAAHEIWRLIEALEEIRFCLNQNMNITSMTAVTKALGSKVEGG